MRASEAVMPLHGFNPVYLWDGNVSRGLVDVEGAARFMAERWPDEDRLPSYAKAQRALKAALAGTLSASAARASLVDAATDAQILDRKAMDGPVLIPTGNPKTHWHRR
jgi:hypothetical protein